MFIVFVPGNLGQVGQVTRIDSNAESPIAEVMQGHGHGGKVQKATPEINTKYIYRKFSKYTKIVLVNLQVSRNHFNLQT